MTTPKARIYQPAKTAMQSGRAKTGVWLFEYDPPRRSADPLIGWTGSDGTLHQLRLKFPSQAAAIAFAQEHRIEYEIENPHYRTVKPKSYADNFRFDRIETYVPPVAIANSPASPAKKPAGKAKKPS